MTIQQTTVPLQPRGCLGAGRAAVERALCDTPGVLRAAVNPVTEMAYIEFDPAQCDAQVIEAVIRQTGYAETRRAALPPPVHQPPPLESTNGLRAARRVVAAAFGPASARPFAVRYWTGDTEAAGAASPAAFTLVIAHPGVLRRCLLPPSERALGEAFIRGDLDVDGDLEAAGTVADALRGQLSSLPRVAHLLGSALRLRPGQRPTAALPARPRWTRHQRRPRHSKSRDAAAIRHHYDVGNEFYQLWLDAQMVYSCAYFPPGVHDLETAQEAKLDYICRKLRLRPGERLLDIGCGWGALIRYAARHYGVEAVGITLSPAQAGFARRYIASEGLEGRCRVEIRDYRDLPHHAAFDKVASIGMFEHVGRAQLPAYFAAAFRVLHPGGLFLNHGIVDLEGARPEGRWTRTRRRLLGEGRFLQRYVFPDGEVVPLAPAVAAAETAGFETRDIESLRAHYVLTLREWGRRLEARELEAIALAGRATYRTWRLYLAISAHAFAVGRIGVVQHVLAKPGDTGGEPRTRDYLYVPRIETEEDGGI